MGVTIHYRGSLADLDRVEDFEDRVLDLALEMGGQARIWRSTADNNPSRADRGIVLDLCPGQDTTSLLISPEGWLIGMFEIEDAEKGEIAEKPWCFVKTQYGSIEGHVALVELFSALKREFFPDLEVNDEGGYWEGRDAKELARKMAYLDAAIKAFAEGLEKHGLTDEAAEDIDILATRLERVAKMVQQTLGRPAEHPPVRWEDGDSPFEGGPLTPEEEARWDESFKENRRMQERVQRTMEERLARGEDHEDAMEAAILEETAAGLPEDDSASEREWLDEFDDDDDDEGAPWRESLPEQSFREADDEDSFDEEDAEGDSFDAPFGRERHPLQQRASDLLMRLHKELPKEAQKHGCFNALLDGACNLTGGLAQALAPSIEESTPGLSAVQYKRALRGAAFAQGGLFPLRADGILGEELFNELYETLAGLQTDIYAELQRLRGG